MIRNMRIMTQKERAQWLKWQARAIAFGAYSNIRFVIGKAKCRRCRHTWHPRSNNPLMCPACKSRRWADPRKARR